MKIWAKTEEFSEGKYLVVRRDGTVPEWPHFVMGGFDPCVPAGLRAYADEAERRGYDPEYVASIRELAGDFERLSATPRAVAIADPDAPPHRRDNPSVIAMMRGHGDLQSLGMPEPSPPRAVADLLEALDRISGGSFPNASTMAITGDWHGFAESLQMIARSALAKAKGVS